MDTAHHPPAFGALLRRHRTAAGLTQEELAERASLSPRAITALERGERSAPRRETIRLLAGALSLSERETAALITAARSTTRPRSAPPREALSPPLVGRAAELAAIDQQLADGGPTLLLLAGEPGIGKTRLLDEAARRAGERGWAVLSGSCTRRGGQEPYAPVTGALAGYLAGLTPAQRRRALEGCAWLARLLPEYAASVPAPSVVWPLPPERERRLMFNAAARLLTNAAGPAGTLLLLDDLQWAGPDALDLIAALVAAPSGAALRILAAYRDTEASLANPPDPLDAFALDLTRAGLAARRRVRALDPGEAARLLDGLLPPASVSDPDLRADLLRRADGVPFFIVSLANGVASGDPAASIPSAGVPWDVAELIRQRAAALPAPAQELLRVAAVIGRVAPADLLIAILARAGRDEDGVLADLDAACRARLLLQDGTGACRFAHDLIREVIVAGQTSSWRAAAHRHIAEALEAQAGEQPIELLAHHYDRSDRRDQAVTYLGRAAQAAATRYAHAQARTAYERQIAHLDALGRAAEVAAAREGLADALVALARYDDALVALARAEATYRAAADWEGLSRVTARLGWVHAQHGTPEDGLRLLRPARDTLAAQGVSPSGLAALDVALAQLCYSCGRYDEQYSAATRAATLARQAGDARLLAQAEMRRGNALLMMGRMEEGAAVMEAAVPLAEAASDLWSLVHALNNVGVVYETRGEFDRTRAYVERAETLAARIGDPTLSAFIAYRRGKNAYYSGVWDAAGAAFAQARGLLDGLPISWVSAYPPLGLGKLLLARGDEAAALPLLTAAIAFSESRRDMQALKAAHAALAERELLAGRPDAALPHLTPFLDTSARRDDIVLLLPLLAWARLESGDPARAAEAATRAVTLARAETNRFDLVDALRISALIAARQGDATACAAALRETLALSRSMRYPYAELKALYVSARIQSEAGAADAARADLTAAQAIREHLGEGLYARAIQQAIAALDVSTPAPVARPPA